MPNRVYPGDRSAFRRGARAFLVNMPLVGKVLSREKGKGERQGKKRGIRGFRVDSGVAKGAFHLRRRQLGDRSTIRPSVGSSIFYRIGPDGQAAAAATAN